MIRTRCNWYELGETSNKFSLNLEKYRASHSTIRKVIYDAQEITDHQKINNHFFFRSIRDILKKNCKMTVQMLRIFKRCSNCITNRGTKKICEGELMDKEIYQSLTVFKHGKQ